MGNKLRLEGDHSYYHGGSAAVFETLRRIAADKGWHVVKPDEPYDVMVMNGEGTMHHGWDGAQKKIATMREALSAGKPVHLINTVWQENPPDFDDLLRSLSSITVRETRSRDDLLNRHGIEAKVVLDVSVYADFRSKVLFAKNFRGRPAVTDFYREARQHVWTRRQAVFRRPLSPLHEDILEPRHRLHAYGVLRDHWPAARRLCRLQGPRSLRGIGGRHAQNQRTC